jgi:CrcB protein
MSPYILVALGSAIGGVARFWCGGVFASRFTSTFPWATLFVNVSGSLLIGLIAALTQPQGRWGESPLLRDLLMVGVLGGYTTFSAFSLQTLMLIREGRPAAALMNVGASMMLCLAAVWVGYLLASSLRPAVS